MKPIQVKRHQEIDASHIKHNQSYLVHNGKTWVKVLAMREMISHKFGEFAKTRINRPPVKKIKRKGTLRK